MSDFADDPGKLAAALERHQAGDAAARDELINLTVDRITRLARHVLKDFPGVARWEQTDDVVQNVALRLWQSLTQVQPPTLADLFRFSAAQIRRELTDLARKYGGPEGIGANHASGDRFFDSSFGSGDETHEPGKLAAWTEFHAAVEALPDEERAAFDLLWYQGMNQADAALLLGVDERTIRRRWRRGRVAVFGVLTGEAPP